MPDFVELTPEETEALRLFDRFNRRTAILNLRRLQSQAAITLADVITSSVVRKRPQPYELLALLAQRRAVGYDILARNGPAMQWARYKRYKAFRALRFSA